MIITNVHGLSHIADDVKMYGPLETYSAFPFESYLSTLKRLIRSPNKPLQQLSRRLVERGNSHVHSHQKYLNINGQFNLSCKHDRGPCVSNLHGKQFSKIVTKTFSFKLSTGNNCCMMEDGTIVLIGNIIQDSEDSAFIVGKHFRNKEDYYKFPCQSSKLDIYLVTDLSLAY
ncbi:hypothetical protein X975_10500, partial [Stegodyphus mimosarum]